MSRLLLLLLFAEFFLINSACDGQKKISPIKNFKENDINKKSNKPIEPENAEEADLISYNTLPALSGPQSDIPIYGGNTFGGGTRSGGSGGGGSPGHRRSHNKNNNFCGKDRKICNDHNPCTTDTCENKECVYRLDESKTEFGSCETDGHSCTIGKCVEDLENNNIFCFEQPRDFISKTQGGCKDDNVCTADSCIEIPKSKKHYYNYKHKDKAGNVILDNEYQCVQEIMHGLPCFTGEGCSPGICTELGNGNLGDEFQVSCVADAPEQPTDCSANLDPDCQIGFCDLLNGCQTIDFTGPYGAECETPYPGICAAGQLMCLEGVNTQMCEPLIRPGDKLEICNSGLDENCDGEQNEEGCICSNITGTARYVDPAGDNNNPVSNDCSDQMFPCATIVYAIGQAVSGDTIVLSAGTYNENSIAIGIDLNLIGPAGADMTIVDAENLGEVFSVPDGITVSFCGITITNGIADDDVMNSTTDASDVRPYILSNYGGGIYNEGSVSLTNCIVSNNTADFGGGGILNTGGIVTITNSTISGNTAIDDNGGGIFNEMGSTATITNSAISGNTAIGSNGGGIFNNNLTDTITITNSTISVNEARNGGGIYNRGEATITNSTISVNTSDSLGGGILNAGTATITNSTISGNTSTLFGGGVYNNGTTTISNSTISGNDATRGGGLYNESETTTTINNSTIAKNNATTGGGIYLFVAGTVSAFHTIIADQSSGLDCNTNITTDAGFNLDKDGSCGVSRTVGGFTLPALGNYGGPTKTHALIPGGNGSEAIDYGDTSCGVTVDQRGELRPIEIPGYGPDGLTRCDIGAYERQLIDTP